MACGQGTLAERSLLGRPSDGCGWVSAVHKCLGSAKSCPKPVCSKAVPQCRNCCAVGGHRFHRIANPRTRTLKGLRVLEAIASGKGYPRYRSSPKKRTVPTSQIDSSRRWTTAMRLFGRAGILRCRLVPTARRCAVSRLGRSTRSPRAGINGCRQHDREAFAEDRGVQRNPYVVAGHVLEAVLGGAR